MKLRCEKCEYWYTVEENSSATGLCFGCRRLYEFNSNWARFYGEPSTEDATRKVRKSVTFDDETFERRENWKDAKSCGKK